LPDLLIKKALKINEGGKVVIPPRRAKIRNPEETGEKREKKSKD